MVVGYDGDGLPFPQKVSIAVAVPSCGVHQRISGVFFWRGPHVLV